MIAIHPKVYEQVINAYNTIEEQDPDISTEKLLQMTSDMSGYEIDVVVDVLRLYSERQNEEKPQ